MHKIIHLLAVMSLTLLLLCFSLPAIGEERIEPDVYPERSAKIETQEIAVSCPMEKHNGNGGGFWLAYGSGSGSFTYFNPEVECGTPSYPFQITDFAVGLWDFSGLQIPFDLDIVVYDLSSSGNPCDGPGAELCRIPVVFEFFDYLWSMNFTFSSPCCVEGPFFIGIIYRMGSYGDTPTIIFDLNQTPDTCDNWYYNLYDSLFYEWYDWWLLYEPEVKGYPLFWVNGETESAICTGEGCDCIPGDANNDGQLNVGDAVYLIAYVFKGGPEPQPYALCSGDANGDCQCNVGDAVYLISYVFKGGPAPPDCMTWLSVCGLPLRK